jgi:hypothetical protein
MMLSWNLNDLHPIKQSWCRCHLFNARTRPEKHQLKGVKWRTLGLGMAAVLGTAFIGLGLYLLIDRMRTGVLFRQRRITYAAFTTGVLAIIGVLIVSAN